MATSVATQLAWEGTGVRIAEVVRRIHELRAQYADGEHRSLTSVLNLIAWTLSPEEAVEVEGIADSLSDHHPSRAVIVTAGGRQDGIDARVEIIPHRGATGRENLLVEQIVLTLHGAVIPHAGSAVIPLLRSELPTFLWWPGAPDVSLPQYTDLTRVANRIVTETGRTLRGFTAAVRLAEVVAATAAPVTDLAWAAVTPWRQLITGSMRGDEVSRARSETAHVTVTSRSGAPSLEAYLVAGWLSDLIGPHLTVDFADSAGNADIDGVTIAAGGTTLITVERDGPTTVSLTCPTCAPRSLPLISGDRRQLISGELELRGRDPVFERAVRAAVSLPSG